MKKCIIGDHAYDLERPVSLAIGLNPHGKQVNCYAAEPFQEEVIRMGDFVGSVAEGGPVNYTRMHVTPHGNGTHTECIAHISTIDMDIRRAMQKHHFEALVLSLTPEQAGNGDLIMRGNNMSEPYPEAVIVRSLPNTEEKRHRSYNNSNPPYFDPEWMAMLAMYGVSHFLTDLPSVDPEVDGGALKAHKAFWDYPEKPRMHATITELIYVPDSLPDGYYLLELNPAPFGTDAAPSNPVLYPRM